MQPKLTGNQFFCFFIQVSLQSVREDEYHGLNKVKKTEMVGKSNNTIPNLVEYWPLFILNHLKCDFRLSQTNQYKVSEFYLKKAMIICYPFLSFLSEFVPSVSASSAL